MGCSNNFSSTEFNLNMIVQPNTKVILADLIQERASFILKRTKEVFDKIDAGKHG